jgi:hypothetical protein
LRFLIDQADDLQDNEHPSTCGPAMAKPADFYVGVLDVFSILLPGAVVSWTAWIWLDGPRTLAPLLPQGTTGGWVAFVLVAFATGHVVFMLASLVDVTFNPFRKYVLRSMWSRHRRGLEEHALQAANALRLVSLRAEPLAGPGCSVSRAEAWAAGLLRQQGPTFRIPEPTNTYQWSRAVLRLRAPAALAEVLRLEADSKFFRSLFVVFVFLEIAAATGLPRAEAFIVPAGIPALLAVLSYFRYAERRQKAIIEAYRSVIVLFAIGKPAKAAAGEEADQED